MRARRMVLLTVLVALFLLPLVFAAETPVPADETPESLRAKVLALARQAKLTDEVIELFKQYSLALAKERLAKAVAADFWPWLAQSKEMQEGLVLGLYPGYDSKVVAQLDTLRKRFGAGVDSHPALALAFAFDWAHKRADGMCCGSLPAHLRKDRKFTTMEESFAYYLKFENAMKYSLKSTPWQLLVHVADNEVPIWERLWVLSMYGEFGFNRFRGMYYKPPYDFDMLRGQPKMGSLPWTLANIEKIGGVCVERAYFASRVFKCLGVPSFMDSGEGARGGHAWVAYAAPHLGRLELLYAGRFDFDKYYVGTTFCPCSAKELLDRETELLVAACSHSPRGYNDACVACHIYGLFPKEERVKTVGLLEQAIERNPYCALVWRSIATACVDGTLEAEKGEKLYDLMLAGFQDYPDLTFEVLCTILGPRLKAEAAVPDPVVSGNMNVLEKAFQLYEKAQRPDLGAKLCSVKGKYLEDLGRKDDALLFYMRTSEAYASEHYGFVALFKRALALLEGPENQSKRLKYIDIIAAKVPEYQTAWNRRYHERNPSFVYVLQVCVKELRNCGQNDKADDIEARYFGKKKPAS